MDPLPFPEARRAFLWGLSPFLAIAVAYFPDLGHGFIRDDFAWIAGSRPQGPFGVLDVFQRDNGFYRPAVSLSFALNERLFGLRPFGYGLTNLLLVWACMLELFLLARTLGMPWAFGLLSAAVWGLNPHGINMAVLWISGRTALLLVLFSLLAARSLWRGRRAWAALWCLLALFSKEEAVLLRGADLATALPPPTWGRIGGSMIRVGGR